MTVTDKLSFLALGSSLVCKTDPTSGIQVGFQNHPHPKGPQCTWDVAEAQQPNALEALQNSLILHLQKEHLVIAPQV